MADSYSACVLRDTPGWCDWVPFADFNSACKPLSQAELDGYTKCVRDTQERVSGIVSPARAGIEQSEAQTQANELRPGGVNQDLYYYYQHPTATEFFGTTGGQVAQGVSDLTSGNSSWMLYAALAVAGVLILRRR